MEIISRKKKSETFSDTGHSNILAYKHPSLFYPSEREREAGGNDFSKIRNPQTSFFLFFNK